MIWVVSTDPTLLAPGDRVGGFVLVEPLAEGGSSVTWRARSEQLERDVALKVIRPTVFGDERDGLAEARDDAIRVARLEHPNVRSLYEAGEHRGGLYLAAALPSGPALSEPTTAAQRTPAQTETIISELADALTSAHAAGILHRDLRPECVSISRWGHAMLGDFGLTRVSGRTGMLTRAEVMESLRYTAPEIILGRPATPETDTYGLAALAVWCLTAAPPFADRPTADYVRVRTTAAAPLLVAPGVPMSELTALNAAIGGGMAPDPAARPSPSAFATALRDAIAQLPSALRESPTPFVAQEGGRSATVVTPDAAGQPAVAQPSAPPASPSAFDATRVEHRRPVPTNEVEQRKLPWTTRASAVMLAITAGALAVGAGLLAAPGPAPARAIGPFSVTPPDGWTVAADGEELVLEASDGPRATLRVVAGRLPGDPLPAAAIDGSTAAKPEPMVSGRVPLVRYALQDGVMLARPTTRGALSVRCPASLPERRCAALLISATGGRPVPALPDAAVAEALRTAMGDVQRTTGIGLSEMEGDRKQAAAAAERITAGLRDAAGKLRIEGADPGTAAALAKVAKALAREAAAFDDLGTAIDRRSRSERAAASSAAREAHEQLRTELRAFARAGYPIQQ